MSHVTTYDHVQITYNCLKLTNKEEVTYWLHTGYILVTYSCIEEFKLRMKIPATYSTYSYIQTTCTLHTYYIQETYRIHTKKLQLHMIYKTLHTDYMQSTNRVHTYYICYIQNTNQLHTSSIQIIWRSHTGLDKAIAGQLYVLLLSDAFIFC